MTRMRTFVEYIVPNKKIPAGSAIVHEVQDRDIKKLDIPPNASEFYFFDSPTDSADPYDAQNDQHNCSAFYLVGVRVVSAAEAKRLRRRPRPARGKNAHKPAALGLTQSQLREAFWQTDLKLHSHFAVMRSGKLRGIRDNNIVVNERAEQLYPKPPAQATEQDITLLTLPALRRRPKNG